MTNLIRQPHGGAISPRVGNGPAAGRTSFRAVKREVRDLLRNNVVQAYQRLHELGSDPDPRVAVIAAREFVAQWNLLSGESPEEAAPQEEDVDVSILPVETQEEAYRLICRLEEIYAQAAAMQEGRE